ncbi:hypothetical protein GA0115237_102252 [Streptomyces sp. ScaeMP-6W]|nr:hypothetical protein GA0115237_102252 [Streptomyces sp. ScaeMP-6W]
MIDSLKDSGFGVGPVCRVLGWSESAYYARQEAAEVRAPAP